MRFVLDTDVIRSGLQSATGASRLILCGIVEKAFVPLVTVATLLELEDVLLRPEACVQWGFHCPGVFAGRGFGVFVMAAYSNYALRVPSSLMADLRAAAERDGVSMNGFVVQAVAEKIAALRARGHLHALSAEEQESYLASRAVRGTKHALSDILRQAGTSGSPLPGDEIPPGWRA